MKTTIIRSLLVSAALFAACAFCPVHGAEVEKQPEPQKKEKVNYGDAFLGLALEKTKLYSGKVEDAIGKAVDVTQKEAPELMREFIVWRTWKHALAAMWPISFLLIGIVSAILGFNTKKGWGYDCPSQWAIMTAAGFIMLFFCLISGGYREIEKLVQVTVAPRIYIAEEVMSLIKK